MLAPTRDDWELLLERRLEAPSTRQHAAYTPEEAGAWSTPASERGNLPPGSRIQRRIPHRCYQVHYREAGSKCFSWGTDGEPPTQAYMCVCVCAETAYLHTHACIIYIYIYLSLSLLHEGVCTCLFASSATQRQSHCGTPFQAEALKVCVHVSLLRRQHNDNRIAALPFRQRHSSRLCNGPGTDTKNPEPRALLRAYGWHIAEFDGGLNPQRV